MSDDTVVYPCNTRKGYMVASEGDGLVTMRPEKARGTVQPQKAPTLTTGAACGCGVVVRDEPGSPECEGHGEVAPSENPHGKLRIRYLTPRECWRLMGQPDWAFDRAVEAGTAKTQLYRQAGNSIVVDVLMAIFKGMYVDRTWEKRKFKPVSLDDFFGKGGSE